ncbi:hypothetical protein Q5741_08615 [Paenibacillus sp. JX-17]|uniref:VCBS repeat-containing protein n=1 Tax=Paenibacillus lacisoli TaxID=3064525 RepID=A0ABT9CB37_9BACL|nr:hypothetical protein [Paenibacillus sp. JX-17]MDO7906479.1 hypothetical protein [Paenibacillus sp. JX-17]
MINMLVAFLVSLFLPYSGTAVLNPQHVIAEAPEDQNVKLYYSGEEQNGQYSKVVLAANGKHAAFDWNVPSDPALAPQLYYSDLNGDGQPEAAVIVTLGSGTGINKQELHLINPNTMKEYPVEQPADALRKSQLSSTVNISDSSVLITVSFHGSQQKQQKPLSDFYDDPAQFAHEVDFSSYTVFSIDEQGQIQAVLSGSITPSEFVGDLVLTYKYSQDGFTMDHMEYKP